jgi:hypothetical protein
MALDFDKVRALSTADLCALALCELSRFTDAVERIAPDVVDPNAEPPACPHPVELRIDRSVMGQPKGYEYACGVCGVHMRGTEVVA